MASAIEQTITVHHRHANGTLASTSVYAPGTAVGERLAYAYGDLATQVTVYACHDQLGSVRRWRTPSKGNWGANEFEPYGEAYAIGAVLAPRDYALHEWDPALAVYRAPYRNYSPTMTRWTTRDPLGMVDGPNMYGYVGGKTMTRIDALGLSFSSCFDDCWQGNPIPTCVDLACFAVCTTATISCMFGPNPACILSTAACAGCMMMMGAKAVACAINCIGK